MTFSIVDDTEGGEDDEQYKSVNFLSFCVLLTYSGPVFLPLSLPLSLPSSLLVLISLPSTLPLLCNYILPLSFSHSLTPPLLSFNLFTLLLCYPFTCTSLLPPPPPTPPHSLPPSLPPSLTPSLPPTSPSFPPSSPSLPPYLPHYLPHSLTHSLTHSLRLTLVKVTPNDDRFSIGESVIFVFIEDDDAEDG